MTLQGEYFTLFVYRLPASNASGFARIVGPEAKEVYPEVALQCYVALATAGT
jgi:hypothetical protein